MIEKDINTPWSLVDVDGVEYKIQPLGCERAFELDAHLLHLFGEGLAALIASGMEGLLPALLMQVAERFSEAQSMEEMRVRLDQIMDLDLGDPEMREFIGRAIGATAPKVADLIRETIPTVANRVTPSQARELVRICLFKHCQYKQLGQWVTMQDWRDMDAAMHAMPRGQKRQRHKWALLIRAIQVTWGPSGAAVPTHPVDERPEVAGE